ncbi:hypothetical protein BGZ90_010537 [Linnemannia elongata]|nr:hypothetical protein BGZ90_010537 [Linnemannia elongata]
MTRLNPSSLLFAALAFSQVFIALVSAAELKLGGLYTIQQFPFYFGVAVSSTGKSIDVSAVEKKKAAVWKLESGSSEGSFKLLHLFSNRYLTVLDAVEQGSKIGMETKPFDFRLENVAEGSDKYRISPSSVTTLTIQKKTDAVELVLQPKSDQQPGTDEWSFVELKKKPYV